MESLPEIPHQTIIAYLRGNLKQEDQARIILLREKYPAYDVFFSIIDEQKSHAEIKASTEESGGIPTTLSASEDLLMRILAGSDEPEAAQQFVDALMTSPIFCRQTATQLMASQAATALGAVPELEGVEIRLDEEILSAVIEGRCESESGMAAGDIPRARSKSWVEDIIAWLSRIPGYGYGTAALVAIVLIVLWRVPFQSDGFEAAYVYDAQVPYAYTESGLRGSPDLLEDDPEFRLFLDQFKLAMGDYLLLDYEGAIGTLENVQATVSNLQSKIQDRKALRDIREYYFYLGVAHLALSRSRDRDLSENDLGRHRTGASNNLATSRSLAAKTDPETVDRDTYFLGLAYGFEGRVNLAAEQLNRVQPESPYYEKSLGLLKRWAE